MDKISHRAIFVGKNHGKTALWGIEQVNTILLVEMFPNLGNG